MSEAGAALFERRLLIVTGKGGVGKTTLAAALGVAAARHGIDSVVIEVGDHAAVPSLLCEPGRTPPQDNGRQPARISEHLYALRIRPEVSLTEYLELQLRMRRLVRLAVRNPGFRRLLDAAPGWRELITLGKLWHLEQQCDDGAPSWGVLIVDAPASGHGLSLLSVPNVVLDTVRLGPLRRHTDWVRELIRDPARTLVLPVTLPEELPVKETLELRAGVRRLGLAVGPLLANGVEPAPALPDLAALLATLGDEIDASPLPPLAAVREVLEHGARRAQLQRGFLDQLRGEVPEPLIELPYLEAGVEDRSGIERLADALESSLSAAELRV